MTVENSYQLQDRVHQNEQVSWAEYYSFQSKSKESKKCTWRNKLNITVSSQSPETPRLQEEEHTKA